MHKIRVIVRTPSGEEYFMDVRIETDIGKPVTFTLNSINSLSNNYVLVPGKIVSVKVNGFTLQPATQEDIEHLHQIGHRKMFIVYIIGAVLGTLSAIIVYTGESKRIHVGADTRPEGKPNN